MTICTCNFSKNNILTFKTSPFPSSAPERCCTTHLSVGRIYPRQGLLGYPLLGLSPQAFGTYVHQVGLPSRTPMSSVIIICTTIFLTRHSNHIFKYVNHSIFQGNLCLNQHSISRNLFKNKYIIKSWAS